MSADTLLVLVTLLSTGQGRTVEAVLTRDSALLLPAVEVHALLGLPPPPTLWTTTQILAHDYPSLIVTWRPRELRVLIDDPHAVLPASRAIRDQRLRTAHGAAPYAATRSGPFISITGDELGRSLLEGGYSFGGRAALHVRQSSTRGTAWAVSLIPARSVFLSYADGDQQPPSASARLAIGPTWVFTTWTPERWQADGLVQIGRLTVFASSRNAFALTFTAAPVGVQVGRQGNITTARLTYGPVMPSPFTIPAVP